MLLRLGIALKRKPNRRIYYLRNGHIEKRHNEMLMSCFHFFPFENVEKVVRSKAGDTTAKQLLYCCIEAFHHRFTKKSGNIYLDKAAVSGC
jgi:hypothetical protein